MKQEDQPTTKSSENTKKNTQIGQLNPRRIRRAANSGKITVIVGAPPSQ
jgi:hypothetical protein